MFNGLLESLHERSVFRSTLQNTALGPEGLRALLLQGFPKLESALDERDIFGVLEISFADQAGQAMGATVSVRRKILIDANHLAARFRQMEERLAAHASKAKNRDIEFVNRHGRSLESSV